jgi:vacuolar-type H+-ATPase subunit I/STV1
MPQICVRFNDADYAEIEERSIENNTTKPRVVLQLVGFALRAYGMGLTQPNETITELTGRITTLEQQLRDKENELGYLRTEYSKLNDALSQRLLAEPKKSFWDRMFGRSKKE